jgi:lactate dehydrogenase-like 2-hydroxyacid dehydrogenase
VLLTRRIPSSVQSKLEAGCSVELYDGASPLGPDELARRLQGKQGLVCVLTDPVNADVLGRATDLRVVSTIAVGYDNVDVAAAHARDIVVTKTPDVLTQSTAEFT